MKRSLAAAAVFFMLATAASRVLGLVREQVMLYYLGLGAEMGAFTVAFKVPSLLRTLVADTALSAAFIPVFSELLSTDRRREAWSLAVTVVLAATVILGVLSVLGVIYAPWVIRFAAPGYENPETIGLAVDLTRIMFPTVLIFGLAGISMGVLNSHDHFALPAIAPIAWNLVIIGAVVFLTRDYGFYALAWGVLAGAAVQLVLQIPAVGVRMRGVGLPRPSSLRSPSMKRLGLLLGPVVLTLGIVNFNALITTMFASLVSEPAPAVIDKAFRLFQLPQGMFAIAIGTVLFPTLSRLAVNRQLADFRRTLSLGLRQIFFVTVPFSLFFIVLGRPTVRLVFEHGKVTPENTAQVAWALAFFSVGMAFVSANTLLNRAFYGLQKAWLPLMVGITNLALNVLLCYLLYEPLGVGGITLAVALVSLWNFLGLTYLLSREIGGVDGRRLASSFGRSLSAAVPLAVAAGAGWWGLDAILGRSIPAQIVSVGGGYAAGALAYFAAARFLGMEEVDQVVATIRRRRRGPEPGEAAPPREEDELV